MQLPSRSRKNHPLRTERLQRHWSQRELAERVGATIATVKRWERQATVPGPYFRLKLTALFGKSEEELGLVGGDMLPKPPPEKEARIEEQPASSPTVSPLWTVPYLRNPYFTGRDDFFHLLDEHFSTANQGEMITTHRAALTQPQAMKGLGGIGKTQIAVEYAYRVREQGQYTHTFWINAASEEALMTSFTQLAELLPAISAQNETDQQKLVETIKQWLEQCSERWFLIFDNADDLSSIQKYIPRYGNGNILLTTRANAVGSLAVSIEVEKMGFVEGTHLLLRRAQRFTQASDEEVNEAGNIAVALDHFPLALEQAGAYIEEAGCSFGHYLQLYQSHRNALLARRGAQMTNYPDSVATTWSLSFQKVEQANPAAAELLRLCAFLAPDHIPEELLRDGAQYWPLSLQQAVVDSFAFDQLLETLLAFSLVKRLAEDHMLSIHRLVQAVQMGRMDSEVQQQWAERMIRAVNIVFPRHPKEDMSSWPQCLRYLEQMQACDTLIQKQRLVLPEAADLLDRSGTYLQNHASYTLAETLYQHALRIHEKLSEAHHPEMAQTLHNLGLLYYNQGKYERAESAYQRALRIREELLGLNHPDTARSLNNLGILYWQQGKYEQAESAYQRALTIKEELLGEHHPDTARSLENLGILYWQQGKYEQAEPLYQRALATNQELLGEHHPEIAGCLNNLGILYFQQGKYEQAEPLHQRALKIREHLLGEHHPDTASSLDNLAESYQCQGKYEQAEPLHQRALAIKEKLLGLEHPNTAISLENLGTLNFHQGKYKQAEPLLVLALAIREQQLGAHHPDTARSLNNLAELYRQQGKYEQAEPLFARALAIQEQTLTSHHPDLADTLYGFARLSEEQGNFQKAVALSQRSLTIREQTLGPEHPKTYTTRNTYRHLLQEVGRRKEALTVKPQVLERDSLCACGCACKVDTSKSRGEPRRFFSAACKQRFYRNARMKSVTEMGFGTEPKSGSEK